MASSHFQSLANAEHAIMLDAGQPAQPGETSRGNLQAVWHPSHHSSSREKKKNKPYCHIGGWSGERGLELLPP